MWCRVYLLSSSVDLRQRLRRSGPRRPPGSVGHAGEKPPVQGPRQPLPRNPCGFPTTAQDGGCPRSHFTRTSLTRTETPVFPARKAQFFQSDPISALPGFSSRSGWTSLTRTGVDLFGRALTSMGQRTFGSADANDRDDQCLTELVGGTDLRPFSVSDPGAQGSLST